jgi:hypothetical protein
MAAVISTTEAACSDDPAARSEEIWLTASAAEATSIELSWICCASADNDTLAPSATRARRSGRPRACSMDRTRSPAPRWPEAAISLFSSRVQRSASSGSRRSSLRKYG